MPASNPRAQGAKQCGQASGQLYSSGGADYRGRHYPNSKLEVWTARCSMCCPAYALKQAPPLPHRIYHYVYP